MTTIHPTSYVHPNVRLGVSVNIGPFCIIEEGAEIGDRTVLQSHVVVRGKTKIGQDVKIFPFACVGMEPQHLKYNGEPTETFIGDRVILRESVTIHRGSQAGTGITEVHQDCYLMAYVHVAHDCKVGEKSIIANAVQIAGHSEIGKSVLFGGHSAITQFNRVGDYAFIGGGSLIRKDLPPYIIGKGDFEVQGINAIGLERSGFSKETIQTLRKVYKIFYLENLKTGQAIEKIQMTFPGSKEAENFIEFVKASKSGILR